MAIRAGINIIHAAAPIHHGREQQREHHLGSPRLDPNRVHESISQLPHRRLLRTPKHIITMDYE